MGNNKLNTWRNAKSDPPTMYECEKLLTYNRYGINIKYYKCGSWYWPNCARPISPRFEPTHWMMPELPEGEIL